MQKRYETLLQQLDKIDNAILEADLLETPLKDLIQLQQHTYSQIESIEKRFKTKAYITNKNEFGIVENLELTLNEA